LNVRTGVSNWLTTTDHKRIALLYLGAITLLAAWGGLLAVFIQINLLTPEGVLRDPETYNRVFTMHGITMVYYFAVPAIPMVIGYFALPLILGAPNVEFPRLARLSFYVFLVGIGFAFWTLAKGGVDTTWWFYPPYSTLYTATDVGPMLVGLIVVGIAFLLTAINFLATIGGLRAAGMDRWRMPIFAWSLFIQSIIWIVATPLLIIAFLALIVEGYLRFGLFSPELSGTPLIYENLFWLGANMLLYGTLIPAIGVVTDLIAAFARKVVFGYRGTVIALAALAVIFFLSWGFHLIVSGLPPASSIVFGFIAMLAIVPFGLLIMTWLGTLFGGSISLQSPMLFALGFVLLFAVGGLLWMFLAATGTLAYLVETYFVVGELHLFVAGSVMLAYFGALVYWWPKMVGRLLPDAVAQLAAVALWAGFNATFVPQLLLGYMGMPRRYAAYPPEFQILQVVSAFGGVLLLLGVALPMLTFVLSLYLGAKADANPWGVAGLAWRTPSPPPPENFLPPPTVVAGPYEYADIYPPRPTVVLPGPGPAVEPRRL
jgi:cytochrome c oxidase subunit 1